MSEQIRRRLPPPFVVVVDSAGRDLLYGREIRRKQHKLDCEARTKKCLCFRHFKQSMYVQDVFNSGSGMRDGEVCRLNNCLETWRGRWCYRGVSGVQQKDGSTVDGPLAAHMHGGSMHGRDICRYQVPHHGDTHRCTEHMLSAASKS